MARVKQRIYERSKERTMEGMLEVCQNTLVEMGMEVTTHYLDKSLIECIGKPPPGSPMGKQNTITVYKEGDKIYIKFKYEMTDPDRFWDNFETNLQIHGANTEEIERKAKVITKICKTIRGMGGTLDEEDAWDFLYHYEKNVKRLPEEEEISNIAIDFIKILDEQGITEEDAVFEEQVEEATPEPEEVDNSFMADGGVTTTATEALIEMIKEIPTLDEETRNMYISLFNKLLLADQEKLVVKIRAIEGDLNKVPYLTEVERKKIRESVYKFSKNKRRQKLAQIIKERRKKEAYYMAQYLDRQIRQNLVNLPFLNREDVKDIMSVILTMPFEEKEKIVSTIKSIEKSILALIQKGVALTDSERKSLRLDLIRVPSQERSERLDQLIEEKRVNQVKTALIRAIPELEFQDNSKIIKEMIWLSPSELNGRILKLKDEMGKKTDERSKIFEKSSAGSACKKCGWPMGSFSKKCPRCGYNPDDEWFDL